jgi:hypothetical protein
MIFSFAVPFKRKKKKIPDLSLPPCIVECSDFDFFEKKEKKNADMDVTCKLNTYL